MSTSLKKTPFWTGLFLLAIAAGQPLHAQEKQPDGAGKLAVIRAAGSKRFSSEQIAGASGLRPGQAVRREDFQGAADRLAALGLFSKIHYRFTTKDENVELDFQVEDATAVPVSFDNFPWFTDDELAAALAQAVPLYDGTAPEQGAYLDAIADALGKLLATRGVHGAVEHILIRSPEGETMIQQFRFAGPGLTVGSVRFGDALANNDPHVRERLADLVGKPYSRYAVQVFDAEQVRPVYLARGYLRVHFGKPLARFAGNPNAPLPHNVVVEAPIELGRVYHWSGSTWSGNTVLTSAELDGLPGFRAGQPADGVAIAAAWERVRAAYGAQGYVDAKVEPEPLFDDAGGSVSYRVRITEGPQYRMGELVVTGLSVDADRRLREAWHMPAGKVFDQSYFDEFITNIVKETFAGLPVHYDHIGHWLRRSQPTKTVDVLLDFE